jgi:hypothetical protein
MRLLTASLLLASLLPAQGYAVILYAGLDGGANVPFHPAMVPPTGLTVEAWVRFDDATMATGVPYFPTIAGQNVDAAQPSWVLRVASGSTNNRVVEFVVADAANAPRVVAWPFAPGELANWTHLAATYDGQVLTLFKNSAPVASAAFAAAHAVQNGGGVLRIGNGDRSIPGRHTWNGMIDELRVWPMPRSAAEIAATQSQTLLAMPGGVLTYNLEGDFHESSTGLGGTGFGTFNAFVDGPVLGGGYSACSHFGNSTTTCPGTIDIAIGSLATVGNGAFTIWCTKAPAGSPLALFVFAAQQAPVQPPFLGVELAFTPQSVITSSHFAPGTFGLGLQRQPLPIPNAMGLIGFTVFGQFVFFDAQCGPQGLSASNGLTIAVQSP